MTDDNWITFAGLTLLLTVLVFSVFYASGAFAQPTVIAQCDEHGICFTTREILELLMGYIQKLEIMAKGKCV